MYNSPSYLYIPLYYTLVTNKGIGDHSPLTAAQASLTTPILSFRNRALNDIGGEKYSYTG